MSAGTSLADGVGGGDVAVATGPESDPEYVELFQYVFGWLREGPGEAFEERLAFCYAFVNLGPYKELVLDLIPAEENGRPPRSSTGGSQAANDVSADGVRKDEGGTGEPGKGAKTGARTTHARSATNTARGGDAADLFALVKKHARRRTKPKRSGLVAKLAPGDGPSDLVRALDKLNKDNPKFDAATLTFVRDMFDLQNLRRIKAVLVAASEASARVDGGPVTLEERDGEPEALADSVQAMHRFFEQELEVVYVTLFGLIDVITATRGFDEVIGRYDDGDDEIVRYVDSYLTGRGMADQTAGAVSPSSAVASYVADRLWPGQARTKAERGTTKRHLRYHLRVGRAACAIADAAEGLLLFVPADFKTVLNALGPERVAAGLKEVLRIQPSLGKVSRTIVTNVLVPLRAAQYPDDLGILNTDLARNDYSVQELFSTTSALAKGEHLGGFVIDDAATVSVHGKAEEEEEEGELDEDEEKAMDEEDMDGSDGDGSEEDGVTGSQDDSAEDDADSATVD